MPEMGMITEKIRTFILETMDEMRKSTWPTRDQLFESTILVIAALIAIHWRLESKQRSDI